MTKFNIKFDSIKNIVGEQLKQVFKPKITTFGNSHISLDIGSAYVKAVSVEQANYGFDITGFACEKIEGADTKAAAKKALFQIPSNKKELSVSIVGQGGVLRYVDMPIMSYEDTLKSMDFELDKHIPFPRDQINYDFAILKKNKNTGKMLVLIAAAKKELIDNRVNLCRDLGYRVSFIDISPIPLANYFEFLDGNKDNVFAVINIGASITSLDIIEDGVLVLSRDIFIAGNNFTKAISESLNKDLLASETFKISSLGENSAQILERIFNNLIGELEVAFDFYETKANRTIDKIFITGGSAQLKGLLDFLKKSINQNITIIEFKSDKLKIRSSLNSQEFIKNFNFYTVALGMAVR